MGNKYLLLILGLLTTVLGLLTMFFSIYGAYLKINHLENGNLFLIISVCISPLFVLSLAFFINKILKKNKNRALTL
ncbi:MAG TPA: hypothetical protein PLW77_09160 [Bacteroidales bacterium]|nr:hypothetical protein [Bacteroidales bacterium]HQB22182.1 hypothetical protein [Bacteroidales bacterium]